VTTIYLLRHGETVWNAEGNRYCGRTDIPLSPVGRAQAGAAAAALAGTALAAVVSSPLIRGRETAAAIAEGRLAATTDEGLLEIDFGRWEGMTATEIARTDPVGWAAWQADPASSRAGGNGEAGAEGAARALAALERLVRDFPSEDVVVVGHNTLNRLLLVALLGAPLAGYRRLVQANGCINVLEVGPWGWRLAHVNAIAHLQSGRT
jgi:broad specificity phosphatase PhoE